jgi:NAD(P)-dependent dehydrogenase (short-subunit alcohol dehydrogenase family)
MAVTMMATVAAIGRTWTEADIPDQAGRVAVVTGASAGIGFQIARVLAEHGAHVVLACRDPGQAEQAVQRIRTGTSRSSVAVIRLDLASLASVREAAEQLRAAYPQIALLVNNAGVMEVPYARTEDEFELTFATNHLGPFALTGLLLDRLLVAPTSRIVTMSSQGHLDGVMNFDDLHASSDDIVTERDDMPERRGYDAAAAYAQSKLANLLFSYELDRRLRAAGARPIALAAHPGVVLTGLFKNRSRLNQLMLSPRLRPLNFWCVQNVRMGALPALRAATDPAAVGGEFYGPRRRFDTGHPARVESSARSHAVADQARLWDLSERLTGVSYRLGRVPA